MSISLCTVKSQELFKLFLLRILDFLAWMKDFAISGLQIQILHTKKYHTISWKGLVSRICSKCSETILSPNWSCSPSELAPDFTSFLFRHTVASGSLPLLPNFKISAESHRLLWSSVRWFGLPGLHYGAWSQTVLVMFSPGLADSVQILGGINPTSC